MRTLRPIDLFIALAHIYFVFVAGWAITHFIFGDRWAWLFLFNSGAPYLFVPLPLLGAIAFAARRPELWVELIVVVVLAVILFGGLFIPKSAPVQPNVPTLTVMTFNVLDTNYARASIIESIRSADADVIALQELNAGTAEIIRRELIRDYPYQILDPKERTRGMGIISRLPMQATGESLPNQGVGETQIVSLDWAERTIVVMNVHPMPTVARPPRFLVGSERVEWTIRERERDIETTMNFAASKELPVIVLGDFNTPEQSEAYRIATRTLIDSWREAGWGFGHTFPAPDGSGGSRIFVAGMPLPTWLVRIDYIFHSQHWCALSTRLGPWDGYSDHRPVISELTLSEFLVK